MPTDFFDDDLVKQRGSTRRARGADAPDAAGDAEVMPARQVSDLNLSRMAKHKEVVEENVSVAAQELERLRQKQENLEKEKRELEELRKKQTEYERGKREIVDRLAQTLITLEKEELHAEKMLETLGATRKRFRTWLSDIENINEEEWGDQRFRDELSRALARIEDVRMEYNKAMAKIETLSREEQQSPGVRNEPVIFEESRFSQAEERGFAYWLKVGCAISLPLIVTLVILWILNYLRDLHLI